MDQVDGSIHIVFPFCAYTLLWGVFGLVHTW